MPKKGAGKAKPRGPKQVDQKERLFLLEQSVTDTQDSREAVPEKASVSAPISGRRAAEPFAGHDDPEVLNRARNSALWAAYGDALGFISELCDEQTLKRRIGGKDLTDLVKWERRVGGNYGVQADLLLGCYSDDTQLRLATSRSIASRGFDAEAFAKVELPVWLAYSLGGGKSTKAAAKNLIKPKIPWYGNTYAGWTDAGGNGAAMRIQPHVWFAHAQGHRDSIIADVVRNSICTHGGIVGILGAVIHALVLDHAMEYRNAPSHGELLEILKRTREVPEIIAPVANLGDIWVGLWERESGQSFGEAWEDETDKVLQTMSAVMPIFERECSQQSYLDCLQSMGLFKENLRGSGVLTALAALFLCWSVPNAGEAIRVCANAVGSDTDTIATMAGAILGATTDQPPPVAVIDTELILGEVDRLFGLPSTSGFTTHTYPDLQHWSPPRVQADALVADGNELHVMGLGGVESTIGEPLWDKAGTYGWQWVRLQIGQTLLIKRHKDLPLLRDKDRPGPISLDSNTRSSIVDGMTTLESPKRTSDRTTSTRRRPVGEAQLVDEAFKWLGQQGYTNENIVTAIKSVFRRATPEQKSDFIGSLMAELLEGVGGQTN